MFFNSEWTISVRLFFFKRSSSSCKENMEKSDSLLYLGPLITRFFFQKIENLKHVIFNNGAHDSVGGQITVAANEAFSFAKIALGCGYKEV